MTERSSAANVVIGVGNPMRRDDGVGAAVLAHLDVAAGPEQGASFELVTLDGEATRLVDAWTERRCAVVVDAVRAGGEPGSIHRLVAGVDDLPSAPAARSSHGAGVAHAIGLAEALDRMPDRLVVIGVEPADLSDGPGLSPAVAAAVPAAARLAAAEVRR